MLCLYVTSCTGSRSWSPRCLFTSGPFTQHQSGSPGPWSKHEFIALGSPGRTSRPCLELRVPVFGEWLQALECLSWPTTQRMPGLGLPSRWVGLGRTVRSGLKGKITQAHFFFPSGFKPITVDSTASKLSLPWMACCSHRSLERSAKRGELRPQGGMEVPGASTSSWGWSWEGRFQPGGPRQGWEETPHKSQTEVPSSRARTQTKDWLQSKGQTWALGRGCWPCWGMMNGARLETQPVTQSVQGGEELLRASRTSDSTHPTPPHPYGACFVVLTLACVQRWAWRDLLLKSTVESSYSAKST